MSSDTLSPFIVLRRSALVLPARGLCPNALGAARVSLCSKMHRCHHPLCCLFVGLAQIVWVVPVHHFFQKCTGATTPWVACLLVLHCPCITFFKNALVLPPLCCLFVGLAQMLWVLPMHHFFQKLTGATTPCAACPWGLPKCSGCCSGCCLCMTFFKNALVLPPLLLLVRGACPNALGAAPASFFSKMHWCYHPLCLLFVGLAQMLWVLPLHHFFQKCTGATTP